MRGSRSNQVPLDCLFCWSKLVQNIIIAIIKVVLIGAIISKLYVISCRIVQILKLSIENCLILFCFSFFFLSSYYTRRTQYRRNGRRNKNVRRRQQERKNDPLSFRESCKLIAKLYPSRNGTLTINRESDKSLQSSMVASTNDD